MAEVRLQALEKRFGTLKALDGVTLTIAEGELFALLGSSGSGKTTALRCVAGLEHPDGGDVLIGGRSVLGRQPYERPIGMVFQSYALFPHLTVFDNVAYGLRARAYAEGGPLGKARVLGAFVSRKLFPPTAELRRRVGDALALVNLADVGERLPGQLSGGMQQRVALARAIITEPAVLLLDEPLSNLDRKLRVGMRTTIRKLQQQLRMTALYVTHDQEEALSLADRMAIMDRGRVVQLGTPAEVYDRPANAFVADFIGAENLMPGEIVASGGAVVTVRSGGLDLRAASRDAGASGLESVGARVRAVVRPQSIQLVRRGDPIAADNVFDGTVRFGAYLGTAARYEVAAGDAAFVVDVPDPRPGALLAAGEPVRLGFASGSVLLVPDA